MNEAPDTFDRARSIAAAVLVAAGAAAIIGTALNWVTVKAPSIIPADQASKVDEFTGLETRSGPYIVIAAGVLILLALLMVARRRPLYAWGAFLTSMVIGALAVQNYRGLDELFYEQMDRVGDPAPALGLMLVAAGGIAGIMAAATAVAASPSQSVVEH